MLDSAIKNILSLKDLRPSPSVNQAFSDLVSSVIEADDNISQYSVDNTAAVRRICSDSESELEIYWAQRIISALAPKAEMANFPYCENYFELVQRELQLTAKSGLQIDTDSRVLMIGSGPLPMTALEIINQTGAKVDHLDSSPLAIDLCSQISQRLNIDCGHILGNGQSVDLNSSYDLILVAGLAGETLDDKQLIVDNVLPNLKPNGRILVRSAKGARALLYPEVLPNSLKNIELLQEYHPRDEVINSVLIYKSAI